MNKEAAEKPVRVHPHTFAVLTQAQALSARTAGIFDVTIAPQLIAMGFLPRPSSGGRPRPQASWRDIELMTGNRVRYRRPLWVDLGGIAKGYAVDHAVTAMSLPPEVQVVANAGGDLRIAGPSAERVLLGAPQSKGMMAVVEIENGSLASSGRGGLRKIVAGRSVGPHLNGSTRTTVGARSFVSVLAQDCMIADALTKVVLALGRRASPLLRTVGATAHLFTVGHGWRCLGAEA
jgi:thiamine biosynthesis lipoprotein